MEKYVVSRELAQKLKEANFPQDTVYCWYEFSSSDWDVIKNTPGGDYAAPMSDEIIEQLPRAIRIGNATRRQWLNFKLSRLSDQIGAGYGKYTLYRYDKKFADALAVLWLRLNEQNILPTGGDRNE